MELLREIGSSLAKQRALLADAKKDLQRIQTIQTSLQEILNDVWASPQLDALKKSKTQWKAFVDLVGSARVLSVAAQADHVLSSASTTAEEGRSWISDGKRYAQWLGGGIASLARERDAESAERWDLVADLCGRSFNVGYTDDVVATIVSDLALKLPRHTAHLQRLVQVLKPHEQRKFLLATLNFIAKHYIPLEPITSQTNAESGRKIVASCAALVKIIVSANEEPMGGYICEWLQQAPNVSVNLCRSAITATSKDAREMALELVWTKFSDQLLIKHAPIVQQDDLGRVLLLLAGTVYRTTPMAVFIHAHSTIHTNGVSSRLSSSSPRARFLGMAVGSAVSQLADKPESRMKFQFEGDDEESYQQLRALLDVDDHLGAVDDLPEFQDNQRLGVKAPTPQPRNPKQPKTKPVKSASIIQVIEEDPDDGIVPYSKPDSDPEDSDEDPSIARRTKPKAPVYIRDLITQLGNEEDADTQYLALTTAPSLIRRKADFGTELSDRAIELSATYFNLPDPFGFDDFLQLRLQGMVALVVAQPKICGPYVANTIFDGDFNISQRVAGLTAMGLAARELAGYKPDDAGSSEKQFPSKTLPERLHRLYLQDSEMDHLSKELSNTMLQPVSTKQKRGQRRIIRNNLNKLMAEYLFFPLTGHFAGHAQSLPSANKILPTFVKTLSIMLTSAGPSTLTLPQLTVEMFSVLLSLRSRALNDRAILEALLFGFLLSLNVNEDKRSLAERHAKEVVEVHEWCNAVFERVSVGRLGVSEEEERVKTLCAGVLVATKEVMEKYERLMLGELVGFAG